MCILVVYIFFSQNRACILDLMRQADWNIKLVHHRMLVPLMCYPELTKMKQRQCNRPNDEKTTMRHRIQMTSTPRAQPRITAPEGKHEYI